MKTIQDIEQYAKENYVPIARKPLIEYLIDLVQKHHYAEMLEIGTGIAYTCICLCNKTSIHIHTIEYSKDRYQISLKNVNDFNLNNKITLLYGDASDYSFQQSFDLIFIDAAKLKNKQFFLQFSPLLSPQGTIIIDNMNLEDFAKHVKKEKLEKYLNNNRELIAFIESLPNFKCQYLNIGDGILKINWK